MEELAKVLPFRLRTTDPERAATKRRLAEIQADKEQTADQAHAAALRTYQERLEQARKAAMALHPSNRGRTK